MTERLCPECGVAAAGPQGGRCKVCRDQRGREAHRRYYRKNADKINAKKGETWRRHYSKNPEKHRARVKAWRKANPEWLKEYEKRRGREIRMRARFGISEAEYQALLEAQEGRCWICRESGRTPLLFIDHDHATGKVRGLLCQDCNFGLSAFRDRPEWLRRGAEYLENETDPVLEIRGRLTPQQEQFGQFARVRLAWNGIEGVVALRVCSSCEFILRQKLGRAEIQVSSAELTEGRCQRCAA